jgi:hypothetical protein
MPNEPEMQVMELLQAEWDEALDALAPPVEASVLLLPAERRLPVSPLALFAQLEEVREEWRGIFTAPQLAQFAERRINTRWSLKDLLGHMAYWAAEFAAEVRTAGEDGEFDYAIPGVLSEKGPTEWNEKEVMKRRDATLESIFEEYDRATVHLQESVLAMPEPQLFSEREFPFSPTGDPAALWHGPAAMIPFFKCMHDRYHFAQIEKWLAKQRGR